MPNTSIALPDESIEDTILLIRGKKVILDHDLARLYGVATRTLNQAVKRNLDRFPEDFMFRLTKAESEEWQRLKSRGTHIKYQPYAFTEHGILMLSSARWAQLDYDLISLCYAEDMALSTDDNHLACDRRGGHHDFSNRISGKQFVRWPSLDDKYIAILTYKIEFPIRGNW